MKGMIKRKDSKMVDKNELDELDKCTDYLIVDWSSWLEEQKKIIEENPQIIQRLGKMKEILEKRKSNHSSED